MIEIIIFLGLAALGSLLNFGGEDSDPAVEESQGSEEDDTIVTGDRADLVQAAAGDDTIDAGGGDDTIYGGDGDDQIQGRGGADDLSGETGADTLRGGWGDDLLQGGAGNDDLRGAAGDDIAYGDDGDDAIDTGTDNDSARGGAGDDTIFGQEGDDELVGDAGYDEIFGGSGSDLIDGVFDGNTNPFVARSDLLDPDTLSGGAGTDFITMGSGDQASGGEGADIFTTGTWVDPDHAPLITDLDYSTDFLVVVVPPDYAGAGLLSSEYDNDIDPTEMLIRLDGQLVARVADAIPILPEYMAVVAAPVFE